MASSLNKKGGSTSSLHKPPSANSLRGYNEQLRSIQQVLARQFAGSQPSSSQKQNPQTSPIRAKKQQETSKPAIPSEGSTAEDAIEVKSEDEDSMNDDFSHRGNYSLSSYTFFTPDLTGVTAPLRASSDQKEDTRYADAEDAEMSQNDAAESDFIFPEDRILRLQSSVETPTAQMQPSVPKRSRPSGSSNGDAPRSAKQIRSPEKEPFNTNISSVTQQYGAQKDNTSQDSVSNSSLIHPSQHQTNLPLSPHPPKDQRKSGPPRPTLRHQPPRHPRSRPPARATRKSILRSPRPRPGCSRIHLELAAGVRRGAGAAIQVPRGKEQGEGVE